MPGRDGIGKAHVPEGDAAERRNRQRPRPRRRLDLGARRQQLEQPLGRAGRLRQLAPHLRELGDGAGREHGIEHELAEAAAADVAADHQARAEPQDGDDAGDDEGDGDGREAGAGQQTRARRREGPLDRGGKAARDGRLLAEGVHGAHGAEVLGGVGRGVSQPILGGARQAAHGPAVSQQRKDDQRDGRQRQRRQHRAGHEHHGERAHQHDAVAQRLAQRRAGGGLDLRGVGGEPAHHLAGMRLLVEGGAQRGQMPEDLRAQVGDHALAQPVDRVHARRAGERQHQADADQGDEVEIDEAAVVAGKADIDHAPHGDRHGEHGGSREDQRHQRQRHHAGMPPDIGP